MKRFVFLLLVAVSFSAFAQKSMLYVVNTVKPKPGQRMAFEAAYKAHVAKFHKTSQKIFVDEILSGPYAGYYHVVNGPTNFEELDAVRPDDNEHNTDLDKNYAVYLENRMNGTYRWEDSMSFHADVKAEKYIVNVRHIKSSLEEDYRNEQKRSVMILNKLKGAFWENLSFNYFEQLWDGSEPVIVSIRNLKDGFKVLERDYFGPTTTPTFKEEYIKAYGTLDWDKRIKLLDDAVLKTDQYIMKRRNDLSSQ
jgi:hypothetical protein